jgi:hypothetical protein
MEYEFVSRSELISNQFPINDFQIKIKGESVNKVILYGLRLSNSGSKPILRDDFEKPISIHVPDNKKIYLVRLKKKIPDNLILNYELKNNKLLIEPLLLNSGDEFNMELYSSSDVYPIIDVRIAGISKLTNKYPDSIYKPRNGFMICLIFFLLIFYSKSASFILYKIVFKRINPHKIIYPLSLSLLLGHGMLSAVCVFSFVVIFSFLTDYSNLTIYSFALICIPIMLGTLWGMKERQSLMDSANS